MNKNIAVIGASGAIGNAFVEYYSNDQSVNTVYAFSRNKQSYENKKIQSYELEIENQNSIQDAAEKIKENLLNHIIVATGILHSENFGPVGAPTTPLWAGTNGFPESVYLRGSQNIGWVG